MPRVLNRRPRPSNPPLAIPVEVPGAEAEIVLLAMVIWGSGILLLHSPPVGRGRSRWPQDDEQPGARGTGPADDPRLAYLEGDEMGTEAGGGIHGEAETNERGAESRRPDDDTDVGKGDKEEGADELAEDDEHEELPHPVMQSIPEEIRVDKMQLRDDEQRETPPKRPFYWWNHFRQANGGFPVGSKDKERHLGPDDIRPAKGDSTCPGCSGRGFCRNGVCVCAAAYEGHDCAKDRGGGKERIPSLAFNGSFILSREKLRTERGLRFHTDPLDEPPPTKPYIRVPLSREVWEAQPDSDRLSHHLFENCAVVGSSGLLRLFRHGKEIDSADMVIRFNRAPTRGFERFVGTRTSYRLAAPMNAGWQEGNETVLLPMPTKSYLYLQVVLHRKHPGSRLYLLDNDFNDFAAAHLPSLPTIGFLAVLLAMQRCANIRVYGFHIDTSYGIPYHYYNNEVPRRKLSYANDLREEAAKIRRFARHQMLTLADPCAAGCEAETGIKCTGCPPGSQCACQDRYPLPVALPGFCRFRGAYSCFYACPGGTGQCPGGIKGTKCSKNITKALDLRCATQDDVKVVAARTQAEAGESLPRRTAAGGAGGDDGREEEPQAQGSPRS